MQLIRGTPPPQAVPLPFQGRLLERCIKKGSPERGAGTRSVTEGFCFPAEIIFAQKIKDLSKQGKCGMITASRQIIRQDMGDSQSPMPLCRRSRSYTIAFCYASSYYNSLPIFFQYLVFHLLTTEDCLFHNTGFVFALMRCGVIISCTAFCLSRRETVRRDAGVNARSRPGLPRRDFVSIRQKP